MLKSHRARPNRLPAWPQWPDPDDQFKYLCIPSNQYTLESRQLANTEVRHGAITG